MLGLKICSPVPEYLAGKPYRVLIVRAGALGDTLMVTPAIREFRKQHPQAEIDFLCSAGGAEVLASNPHLARILVLRHRNMPYCLSLEKRKLVDQIRSRHYDVVVLLESASRYRELLQRAGISEIRDFAATPFDPMLHNIVNYLHVSGFGDTRNINLDMQLPCSADALRTVHTLLAGLSKPIVAIHPGYGPTDKKKEQANRLRGWDPQKFARVAQELSSSGASIVFTGSSGDVQLCKSIASTLPSNRSRILAGQTTIPQFVAAISISDVLISVDSASAHIAAAVGTPLVVLWGPAILKQTRPVSSTTPIVIVQRPVPCAPCYGTRLMKTCKRNICMEQIEPDEVVQRAMEILERRSLPVLS